MTLWSLLLGLFGCGCGCTESGCGCTESFVLDCPLNSTEEVGERRMLAKLNSIIDNPSPPLHDTVGPLAAVSAADGSTYSARMKRSAGLSFPLLSDS